MRQLEHAAAFPDVVLAAGMPDLHPGKGSPVGAVIATDRLLYPFFVGNDIGCGMGFWQTNLETRKAKPERLLNRLRGLEGPWEGISAGWLEARGMTPSSWDTALGTIGGGNHFAELQRVREVVNADAWRAAGLDETAYFLLVHSGSRGMGECILRDHVARHNAGGIEAESEEGERYRARHAAAARWAEANREAIARRFLGACRGEGRCVHDSVHNGIARETIDGARYWLHRKGAAASTASWVILPGSRGACTYLATPTGDQSANLHSIAHGAGRKWNRASALERMKERYRARQLAQTKLGGHVICEDKKLLFEEAPEAYKNIETVVEALTAAKLMDVVAILEPAITYKTRMEEH